MKKLIYILTFLCICHSTDAQTVDSTIGNTTFVIKQLYKFNPKEISKVTFQADQQLDTSLSSSAVEFQMESQRLNFPYDPIATKPIAWTDTSLGKSYHHYLKIGLGNHKWLYLRAGTAWQLGNDWSTEINGHYLSAKGNIPYQNPKDYGLNAGVSHKGLKNLFKTYIYWNQTQSNLFGYTAPDSVITPNAITNQWMDIGAQVGLEQNKSVYESKLKYSPMISIYRINNRFDLNEFWFALDGNLQKALGNSWLWKITPYIHADYINSINKNKDNTIFGINTSFQFTKNNFITKFVAEANTVDGHLFGSITPEYSFVPHKFKMHLLLGHLYEQYTLKKAMEYNPYVKQVNSWNSAIYNQFELGASVTPGSAIDIELKAGFQNIKNQLYFRKNDSSISQNDFNILFLDQTNLLYFKFLSKIQIMYGLVWNLKGDILSYNNDKYNDFIPNVPNIKLQTGLNYLGIKKLNLGMNLAYVSSRNDYTFDLKKSISGYIDLSFSGEYNFNDKIGAWLQFNNVLNQRYYTFYDYSVIGINILGGVNLKL